MNAEPEPLIVTRHTAVFTEPPKRVPSDRSVDGPILGNGDVGIVVGGTTGNQVFYVAKNDFWSQNSTRPLPIGQISVRVPAVAGAQTVGFGYHQEQDLAHAEVRAKIKEHDLSLDVRLRSWVAAVQNLLVIEIDTDSPAPVDVEVELKVIAGLKSRVERYADNVTKNPVREVTTAYPVSSGCDGKSMWITRCAEPKGQPGREAAVAVRILGSEATYQLEGRDHAVASFALGPGKSSAVLVAAVLSDRDKAQPCQEARSKVAGLDVPDIAPLNQAHREWWREFWSASFVDIEDQQIEGFWYGALYELACCNRAGKIAPGLWGNWVTTDTASWHGDYHLNYNMQTPYYGVYSSNHVELASPYYDAVLAYLPKGRMLARDLGCRGVHFPVAIGPDGMTVEVIDFGQRSNAVFCALNFITHYECTQDRDFLRTVAYPFLLELSEFWEDFLKKDEQGRYVVLNSNPVEEQGTGTRNSVIDLSLVRTLFKTVVAASEELGVHAERREKWRDVVDHLAALPSRRGKDGGNVFIPCEDWPDGKTENWCIGAWGIWPGGCVNLGSSAELLETAHRTLSQVKWRDNHPQLFCQGVRVGYGPTFSLLKETLTHSMCPNYHVYYWGGGVETCGIVMAINEMLLQSHEGFLRLFPVWPRTLAARFGRLRAAGAFLVSSELKNGAVQSLLIESEKGKDCTVLNPWTDSPVRLRRDGHAAETLAGAKVTFKTTPGEAISLARG
ncbi:MAG: hypothetical protein A3K19_01840 [Lentisphaerae bacterium RIFOXYB12_FULL_65_16]|nr:MAG: hypothetical protein A3K18_02485 [Lentisphaerae bacterium RIFOXYA12_64_32]OGV92727.1 MAG: hypothetical protein A3K19_01840 [Lentisphaerae bacterium RIFOXYB12_FULL_65_16]